MGAHKSFIVVPETTWEEKTQPRKLLGQWLIENAPRSANLEIPDRGGESHREIPFADVEGVNPWETCCYDHPQGSGR